MRPNLAHVGHSTETGASDQSCVFCEDAAGVAWCGRFPLSVPASELVIRHVELKEIVFGVDRDGVAFMDERERATGCGLRRNVTNNHSVSRA